MEAFTPGVGLRHQRGVGAGQPLGGDLQGALDCSTSSGQLCSTLRPPTPGPCPVAVAVTVAAKVAATCCICNRVATIQWQRKGADQPQQLRMRRPASTGKRGVAGLQQSLCGRKADAAAGNGHQHRLPRQGRCLGATRASSGNGSKPTTILQPGPKRASAAVQTSATLCCVGLVPCSAHASSACSAAG